MPDVATRATDTRTLIVNAARRRLLADGYGAMSTRKVAEEAGVPLSQLHYHFGSKQGLILTLLEEENQRRLTRQQQMYAEDAPLWQRYERACDFLEEDLDSGYVRVLQEMIAAGWSDDEVARPVLAIVQAWIDVLQAVATEAEARFGSLGPFTAAELSALVGLSFLGGEAMILLGDDAWAARVRGALRRVGDLIRTLEERSPTT